MLGWETDADALTAPAVARNRDPILNVLQRVLPRDGLILEIASGSGEHVVHFARHLQTATWQPSDPEPAALRSIAAHVRAAGLTNVLPPRSLDARAPNWPVARADAILSINMIHIAPWEATMGLMREAERLLPRDGCLYLYGPFTEAGSHSSESNALFHADLQARDPAWGLRDIEAVAAVARRHRLSLVEIVAMPANNLSLIFRRDAL